MKIINTATEEVIKEVEEDSLASLQNKFKKLKEGQKDWQNVSLQKRVDLVNAFSELLDSSSSELAGVETKEVGKPLQQSLNELKGARTRIKWLTENAAKYLSEEYMYEGSDMVEKIAYEPLGVICNISAWNYPYLVGVNVFIPALLAGNAVLYKPSEYATITGIEIKKLMDRAGIPDNVFQVAIGAGNVGNILLGLPFDGYFFTGSNKTGKYIYESVAHKMVPCQCELGGKDPLYVADDITDIKIVAASTADGAFYNNGQSCCSVERIYVHKNIYNPFLEEFLKEVKSYKIGSPDESGTYIGPLSRKEQIRYIEDHIKDAQDKGAKILMGGKRIIGKGYYFEPTVLVNVDHSMKIMKEESFGPVIGIMKVESDQQAIELMNDSQYGLTASVYSSKEERAEEILKQLDSGTGYWNCCDRVSASVPWSGRKNSGFGSTLSHVGLRAFTKPKSYHFKKP